MSIFKACDIRGIADKELTNEIITDISRAIGVKLAAEKVVVGADWRESSPRLHDIVVKELVESGCEVIDIGQVATPLFYYALKKYQASGGVMVTASHNPAEYNGLKLALGDDPVTEADILAIAELARRKAAVRRTGKLTRRTVGADYIASMSALAKRGRLKVVLDAGNGAAALFAPELYRTCGYVVEELFCEPDGKFPNRPPNPAYPQNLAKLARRVLDTGADIGVAFDGDGDRVGFVDETGRPLDNDAILVLLAREYLAGRTGTVVYDAKCSMVVPEQIAAAGGTPLMARAGHTFIKRLFRERKAVFAGEVSGHCFFPELGYDDGMFAGLKLCEYVAAHGRLSKLIDALPKYFLTPEIRLECPPEEHAAVLTQVAAALDGRRLNFIDGVRLELPAAWAMIRSSVTEPIFTLRFEAATRERLYEVENLLIEALPERLRETVRREAARVNDEV